MRTIDPTVELASGEFDGRKQNGIAYPGISVVARLYGIKPAALSNYRANYVSRKTIRQAVSASDNQSSGLNLSSRRNHRRRPSRAGRCPNRGTPGNPSSMKDGLYQMSWRNICAGFVVEREGAARGKRLWSVDSIRSYLTSQMGSVE